MREYYQRRAPEYDEWYLGAGRFAELDRPGWERELSDLIATLAALPPARTLDVGCGTGFLTRHLRGEVTALDESPAMLEIAARRMPAARIVQGDALHLPFPDGAFDRVVTAHLYGHLRPVAREAFLWEARRVAPDLVVVDSALRDGVPAEEMQERVLNDGSQHTVFKRYLSPDVLMDELGGGQVLQTGRWFVVVAHTPPAPPGAMLAAGDHAATWEGIEMAVKLHRCSGTWIKGPHPCWQAQKALDEAGIPYELVRHPAFPRSRRNDLERLTGQRKLPVVEFEDGTLLRESKVIAQRAREGTLRSERSAAEPAAPAPADQPAPPAGDQP